MKKFIFLILVSILILNISIVNVRAAVASPNQNIWELMISRLKEVFLPSQYSASTQDALINPFTQLNTGITDLSASTSGYNCINYTCTKVSSNAKYVTESECKNVCKVSSMIIPSGSVNLTIPPTTKQVSIMTSPSVFPNLTTPPATKASSIPQTNISIQVPSINIAPNATPIPSTENINTFNTMPVTNPGLQIQPPISVPVTQSIPATNIWTGMLKSIKDLFVTDTKINEEAKSGIEDEVKPLVFDPTSDYCDVSLVSPIVDNIPPQYNIGEKLISVFKFSKCKKTLNAYFSLEYIDTNGKKQEIFNTAPVADGNIDTSFIIPNDIKLKDNKSDITLNVYQCRPDENIYGGWGFSATCKNDIGSKNDNKYKKTSFELKIAISSLTNNTIEDCTFDLVSPTENEIFTQNTRSILSVNLKTTCKKNTSVKVGTSYNMTCNVGDEVKSIDDIYWEMGSAQLEHDGDLNIVLDKKLENVSNIASLDLNDAIFPKGVITKCALEVTVSTLTKGGGSIVLLKRSFNIKSCPVHLKNINNQNASLEYYQDDPYIPFDVLFNCDRTGMPKPVNVILDCALQTSKNYLWNLLIPIDRSPVIRQNNNKSFLIHSRTDYFVGVAKESAGESGNWDNIKWANVYCKVYSYTTVDAYRREAYNNDLGGLQYVTIKFYLSDRPKNVPFPEEGPSSTSTSTSSSGVVPSVPVPKTSIFSKILNFLGINMK